MKVIIAGGRNFNDYSFFALKMESKNFIVDEVVSGGATGVDSMGEEWAMERGIGVHRFPANWELHGKSAGPIRNNDMAQYADALIAFWDGKSRGTKHMIETMKKINKPTQVFQIQ